MRGLRWVPPVLLLASWVPAAVYQVGPTRTYHTIGDVADLLGPGDVVEVDGGVTYPGDVVLTEAGEPDNPITLRGIRVAGNRPILSGGTNTLTFASPWPYASGADHYVLESFEITAGSTRCLYHQADDLTVRDVLVHDCPQHGILGADAGSGSLLLEYSEVHHCGSGSTRHQIYMATDEVHHPGSRFRMQHCFIHHGNGGNNVKSRAERNEIYYNWIEGGYYHELELIGPDPGGAPDGWSEDLAREDSDVVGNVLFKKTKPSGSSDFFSVVRAGGDGTGQSWGRYRFVSNTILCGAGSVFRLFDGLESVEMHGNIIHRIDGGGATVTRTVEAAWTSAGEQIAGSRNWVTTGSATVPTQWTETVWGASPGLVDLAGDDLTPAVGSPLLNAGPRKTSPAPGFPIPNPLFPPAMLPPAHVTPVSGGAEARPVDGSLDIGAVERVATLVPLGQVVDAGSASPGSSNANGVLEPGEAVVVAPSWRNDSGAALVLLGLASALEGDPVASYELLDGTADYGTVSVGATAACTGTGNCYSVGINGGAGRPTHWDATYTEVLSEGTSRQWLLHVGGSFGDVTTGSIFYADIETLLHTGVTLGCAAGLYCPAETVPRSQMAAFIARAESGDDQLVPTFGEVAGRGAYRCGSSGASLFTDVPTDAWFCRHVHLLAARGITLGCEDGSAFCPDEVVPRDQMALFLARAMAGSEAAVPESYTDGVTGRSYSCSGTAPVLHFADVAADAMACRHAHYLWARGVVSGCAADPPRYCPADPVYRDQMARFLVGSFDLQLYGR